MIKLQIVSDAEFQIIKSEKKNILFSLIHDIDKCVISFNENMGESSTFDIYFHKHSYHYLPHTTQIF